MPAITNSSIAIVGVGNYLMGDDGIGIHAIKYLKTLKWPSNVTLVDAGLAGISLLYIIEKYSKTLLIDCADFGAKAGDIFIFDSKRLKLNNTTTISLHSIDVANTLMLATSFNIKISELYIMAVQPLLIKASTELSPPLKKCLKDIEKYARYFIANKVTESKVPLNK